MIVLSVTHQLDYYIHFWPSSYPKENFGYSEEKNSYRRVTKWNIQIANTIEIVCFGFALKNITHPSPEHISSPHNSDQT